MNRFSIPTPSRLAPRTDRKDPLPGWTRAAGDLLFCVSCDSHSVYGGTAAAARTGNHRYRAVKGSETRPVPGLSCRGEIRDDEGGRPPDRRGEAAFHAEYRLVGDVLRVRVPLEVDRTAGADADRTGGEVDHYRLIVVQCRCEADRDAPTAGARHHRSVRSAAGTSRRSCAASRSLSTCSG